MRVKECCCFCEVEVNINFDGPVGRKTQDYVRLHSKTMDQSAPLLNLEELGLINNLMLG